MVAGNLAPELREMTPLGSTAWRNDEPEGPTWTMARTKSWCLSVCRVACTVLPVTQCSVAGSPIVKFVKSIVDEGNAASWILTNSIEEVEI